MSHELHPNEPYFQIEYDRKSRFVCYWNQIQSTVSGNPAAILEIGIGNKFVLNYLKEHGFRVVSLDYDFCLSPDVTASVVALPFSDKSFHTVICCEVLEHLPFDLFKPCLKEIQRLARNRVVISLPSVERYYRLDARLPKLPYFRKMWELPLRTKPTHKFDGYHYWEIGTRGCGKQDVEKEILSTGFSLVKQFRDFDDPYHQFFILEP